MRVLRLAIAAMLLVLLALDLSPILPGGALDWAYVNLRLKYQLVMFGPAFIIEITVIVVLLFACTGWPRRWMARVALGVLCFALLASPALAQGQPKARAAPAETFPAAGRNVTGTNIPCDPANLLPGCKQSNGSIFSGSGTTAGGVSIDALWANIQKAQVTDLQYAQALAKAVGSPGATARAACWGAWVTLLQQQQGATAGANGAPLGPVPDPSLFTKFEQLAEVVDSLQPNSPFMIACSPVATAAKMNVLQLVTTVVGGVASLGTFGVTLP
jgi:hypothetical protein